MKKTKTTRAKAKYHKSKIGKTFGLLHRKHTGRLLPSRHTSYGALFILLLLFSPQIVIYRGVKGILTSSGNVQVTAKVPGAAPTVPAIITSPAPGTIGTQTITVSGTCGANLLVKIFRNDIFAGSTYCDGSGAFSLPITLFTGRSDLRALNYDSLDQPGPDSPTVTLTYPSQVTSRPNAPTANLLLEVDYHLRQVEPNQATTWRTKITFGKLPYTLALDWGDGNSETRSVSDNNAFDAQHTYTNPGKYTIVFKVKDANGSKTQLQIAILVNGQPVSSAPTQHASPKPAGCSGVSCTSSHFSWSIVIPLFWLLIIATGFLWFLAERQRRREENFKKRRTVTGW